MKIFEELGKEGFSTLIKVHTKKSLHREDGDHWRRELYGALLDQAFIDRALATFEASPGLGMIGPGGHYISMSTYIGANETRIVDIGRRLGLVDRDIYDQGFFAGTMFLARVSALNPLMALSINDDEFEDEAGQIDGTLAHAIERAFALSVKASGQYVTSSSNVMTGGDLKVRATERYGYV